jgi:hypothetical protein
MSANSSALMQKESRRTFVGLGAVPSQPRLSLRACLNNRSSRRKEAPIPLQARCFPRKSEPPYVGCYRMNGVFGHALHWPPVVLGLIMALLTSCVSHEKQTREQRYVAAKDLFDSTARDYHLPSAEAQGGARKQLLAQAATGYERVLKQYPDQPHWCAPALRSLGSVRAAQGRLNEAVKLYDRVAVQYPGEEWEVLQAWKSAADLLCEAGRRQEGRGYYRKIVTRFDKPGMPAIVKTIVRAAKNRLPESN